MRTDYTLGLFANLYPASEKDTFGTFIKREVDSLEKQGVSIVKAVKTSESPLAYPKFYMDCLKLNSNTECDIFQAEYIPHSSLIPGVFKKDIPLILRFLGDDGRIFPYKNRLYRKMTEYMINKSDHIITVSHELKKNIVSFGCPEDKISVIGCGIDTSQFIPMSKVKCREELSVDENTDAFLFIGRLHRWKGIFEILESAELHSDCTFYFIGPGDIPEKHPKNCVFLGSIPHSEMPKWICAADCLLLPSYTEGLPNVIMEAMSCETPVISSNVGGCPELIDENTGILIEPKNVSQLSSAIEWMKTHENERIKLGKAGRVKIVNEYDDKILTDKIIKVHNALL